VTRPLPGYLHKRQWEQDGKQMFSCFVSALGYYIDPRGTEDITGLAADLDRQTRQEREEIRKNRKNDFERLRRALFFVVNGGRYYYTGQQKAEDVMFERIRRRNMALGRITLIERATPP